MLFRVHMSFRRFSNQGFEAAHKLQRQLYLKATSHDSKGYITSLDQILTHLYTEMLLELRLSFREAMQCMSTDKAFFYRGCGWQKKIVHWDVEEKKWIVQMNNLLNHMFGPDECKCTYTKEKVCVVVEDEVPLMDHNHNDWEQIINGGCPNHVQECITDTTNSKALINTSQSGSHNCDSVITNSKAPINTSQSGSHNCDSVITNSKAPINACQSGSHNCDSVITNSKAPINTSQSGLHNCDSVTTNSKAPINACQSDLHNCGKGIFTREETAKLQLPKCQSCNLSDVVLVNKVVTLTNPADVSVRPSESTVQHALKLLSQHRGQRKAKFPL